MYYLLERKAARRHTQWSVLYLAVSLHHAMNHRRYTYNLY